MNLRGDQCELRQETSPDSMQRVQAQAAVSAKRMRLQSPRQYSVLTVRFVFMFGPGPEEIEDTPRTRQELATTGLTG